MPNLRRRTVLAGTAAATLAGPAAGPARAAPPFFKLYLMIPNNQPARMAWGTLAAQQMQQLGIEVVSSFVPFTVISPRRSKGDGKTHVDGGWDAYLERYYYTSIDPCSSRSPRSGPSRAPGPTPRPPSPPGRRRPR